MTPSDGVPDEAYTIFEEWGPKRQVPRIERLAARFSTLIPEQIEWLLGQMADVSKTVRTGGVRDRFVPATASPLGIGATTDRRSARPAACQEQRYAKNTAEGVRACDNLRVSDRPQTLGEEIANSVSHGIALVAVFVAAPFLVAEASRHGAASIVAAVIFALTMALLYSASVLYHALPRGRAKRIFRTLDHGAIYLFIAGSYTPFALGALEGPWGWTLFGLVWSLALLGISLKAFDRLSHPGLSTGLYLLMGWLVVIAAVPLAERVPSRGVALLVAGGLAYTLGVALFKLDSRWRYAHAVWHGFVVVGSGCHFFAVLGYAA